MNISKLLLASAITTSSLFAHSFWLNAFEANSHGKTLVTVGLGSGHNLTIEDSISDRFKLESFDLTTPDGKKIALRKPQKGLEDIYDENGLKIVDSNLAMQKISFGKEVKEGTYSVSFATVKGMFTKYLDNNGKMRFSNKPKDKLRDVKKIVFSSKIVNYGKSYFVNKKWSEPKAVGHDLEIIPVNDISKLYIGDKIELKVLYKGEPLKSGFLIAKAALNKGDNALYAPIRNGKTKVVLTNSGQWKFSIKHTQKGEIDTVSNATATVNIK